jgi:hypothetical protein
MRRDARSFLWDVREAADAIQVFVHGHASLTIRAT